MTGFWAWFHDGWEIIGAFASAAAVIVALWLGFRENAHREEERQAELSRLKEERDEARVERDEQRRHDRIRQARGVATWFELVAASPGQRMAAFGAYDDGAAPLEYPIATVVNHSDMPVFDVQVHAHTDAPATVFVGQLPVLLPGAERKWNLNEREHNDVQWFNQYPTVSVRFRDANEVWWRRDQHGRLHELPPPGESLVT